jgi:hypothetical protein
LLRRIKQRPAAGSNTTLGADLLFMVRETRLAIQNLAEEAKIGSRDR